MLFQKIGAVGIVRKIKIGGVTDLGDYKK